MSSGLNSKVAKLHHALRRQGDGSSDAEHDTESKLLSLIKDTGHLGLKDLKPILEETLFQAVGAPMDDKKLALEHALKLVQDQPAGSKIRERISQTMITTLYNDLPHPNITVAGPSSRYRNDDGSGNNPHYPEMGKAGSPYARNVASLRPVGPVQPDPELVFDQLLRRSRGAFRKHPSGLNRLFFSFATIVIHELFQTNHDKPWINNTSSYLDLSVLYGNTGEEQKRVRTYENGRLYPDSIASDRLITMPPAVPTMVILFSRNHNRIVESLLSINEDGRYREWSSLSHEEQKWQDEDLFQLARNINVAIFAQAVLRDYVAAILNTHRANSDWWLDIGSQFRVNGQHFERGRGNVLSVEFNALYRWHAPLSAGDDKWMEEKIRDVYPDLDSINDLTIEHLRGMMGNDRQRLASTPAREWTFSDLKRGQDGRFDDVQLAKILVDAIEEPAHAFGARSIPSSFKLIEVLGQIHARKTFKVCTLNEFRRFLNLKPYTNFQDWSEDKEVALAAEKLYGDIENLELYPGLVAECTKPATGGSGLCPGQTTGRGILNDAVALVRGDRFLSYDLNSTTLTNWGMSQLSDLHMGSHGGMLPKIIFSTLPNAFTGTSTYAILPFYTPDVACTILTDNKVIGHYDLYAPITYKSDRILVVRSKSASESVLKDQQKFELLFRSESSAHKYDPRHLAQRHEILTKALTRSNFEKSASDFFNANVPILIQIHTLAYSESKRRTIDVVHNLTNMLPILWLADRFGIPLKGEDNPHAPLTLTDTFMAFEALFRYRCFNLVPAQEWDLRDASNAAAEVLQEIFRTHLSKAVDLVEWISKFVKERSDAYISPHAKEFYKALSTSGLLADDAAAECLAFTTLLAGSLPHQASLLIDLFLQDDNREEIVDLACRDDTASLEKLECLVRDGLQRTPILPGVALRAKSHTSIRDGEHTLSIHAGQTILVTGSGDGLAYGGGLYCFSELIARIAPTILATIVKHVFRLQNIRRAPGKSGVFTFVTRDVAGIPCRLYLDAGAKESPVPTSLVIHYDEE